MYESLWDSKEKAFKVKFQGIAHLCGHQVNLSLINRPGVAGAVLQTPPLLNNQLINSVTHPLWKYFQTIITSKPLELGT